jgi:hypothetical protein
MIRLIPGSGVPARHQRELQKDDRKQGCNGKGKKKMAKFLFVHGPTFLSDWWDKQLCQKHHERSQL